MFNVAVLKMKDIKKYLIGMLVTIIVVFVVSKYIPKNNSNSMLVCLKQTVPTVTNIEHEEREDYGEDIFLQSILKTQISSIQAIENIDSNVENKEDVETKEKEEPKQEVEVARNKFSNRSYYK